MKKLHLDIAIYISASLLAVGVFLPITSLSVIGDVTYNRIAEFESYIVVACAIATCVLLGIDKVKLIIIPVIGIWVTLLFPAIQNALKSDEGGFLSKTVNKASGAMQDFAADLFLNVTDFSWGGFVFLLALIVLTISAVLRWLK
jgi:hypothetical protein